MFAQKNISSWSPLYFLAALGAGGMIVTFFMYLLFWIPHPDQPIPVYQDWVSAFLAGSSTDQLMIGIALAGVVLFAVLHILLLLWNLSHYSRWKTQGELQKIAGTNAHTQLLAIPLTLAMSINAAFILGALFVPGLWSYVEWLFPLALSGFTVLGLWALRMYLTFFSHSVSANTFNKALNNSLAQLLPGFAFAMISVGLVAPAAMSNNTTTVAISLFLAAVFLVPAIFISLVKMIIGVGHMLEHGVNKTTLPTLWVGVPILTTLSIAALRIDHGLAHTLGLADANDSPLMFLSMVLATQAFLVMLGYAVMKRMDYFKSLWSGEEKSPVVYALICPGVALSVSLHFFINKGLVAAGLLTKFGTAYWIMSGGAIAIQLLTAVVLFKLIRQLIIVPRTEPLPQSA
ncbi:MAG: hypothetical protein HKP12_14190, partial [Gammaproteobacteria bacterium]|nr:hypothetical protein [Gammaproteobacteria bacterium]NNJ98295.1 hypothetical protein [Gammaproteobacteria bacterium]